MAEGLAGILALCLLGNALSVPLDVPRPRRGFGNNEVESMESSRRDNGITLFDEPSKRPMNPAITLPPIKSTYEAKKRESQTPDPFDEDDDDFETFEAAPTGGGSNIISLLNLASGLFPGSSGPFQIVVREMIKELLRRDTYPYLLRRHDSKDNEIDIDNTFDLKPPPSQRQETEESDSDSDSNESEEDNDTAAEESVEAGDKNSSGGNDKNASQEQSASNGDDDDSNDYDSDEPPGGGDGQGGGILGLLAGLSGGEDGQSDLGSLLAAISGIVVSLSGDGIDLNNIIASAIGLFAGLLSEGEKNPGEIIASYLLTSLDTISGGGSKNNGAFFGKLISKLISGTSAGEAPESSSDESGEPEGMKDSGGFLLSLLMGLSGDMSKSSSTGSSNPW